MSVQYIDNYDNKKITPTIYGNEQFEPAASEISKTITKSKSCNK